MDKNPIPLAPDLTPEQRRLRFLPIASIFVLAPILVPLVLEAVALCNAQWCAILDRSTEVRTPMIDTISEHVDEVRGELWYSITSRFQRVPWNPKVVLPAIAIVMAVAMVMLRL
jgi:hypothetical protein